MMSQRRNNKKAHLGPGKHDQAADTLHDILILSRVVQPEGAKQPLQQRLQHRLQVCHRETQLPSLLP